MKRTALINFLTVTILLGWTGLGSSTPRGELLDFKEVADTTEAIEEKPVEKKGASDAAVKNGGAPLAVFADIEQGWKRGDVDRILRHFGKGKVAIAIEGIGPGSGAFSRNQSFYLFKDLFKYTITKKYEFVQVRNVRDGGRKVFAVAERYYKRTDDGRLFKDKIYVSLQLEDGRWVINEIKSIR